MGKTASWNLLKRVRLQVDGEEDIKPLARWALILFFIPDSFIKALPAIARSLSAFMDRVLPALRIILLTPVALIVVEPWLIRQILGPSRDRPSPWNLKWSLLVGCGFAVLHWYANRELVEKAEQKAKALETVNRAIRRVVGEDGEQLDLGVEPVKDVWVVPEEEGGGIGAKLDPEVDLTVHGDTIANTLRILDKDATKVDWVEPLDGPDTMEVTTSHKKRVPAPTIVRPDLELVGKDETRIWLGTDVETHKPVYWEYALLPHKSVTGKTGSGKGGTVRMTLIHAALNGWTIKVIDPKNTVDFTWLTSTKDPRFEVHKHTGLRKDEARPTTGGIDPELWHSYQMILEMESEMHRRQHILEEYNKKHPEEELKDWAEYRAHVDPAVRPYLFVIDEGASFVADFEPQHKDALKKGDKNDDINPLTIDDIRKIMLNALGAVLAKGRTADMHILYMTQNGDLTSLGGSRKASAMRLNLTSSIVQRTMEPPVLEKGLGVRPSAKDMERITNLMDEEGRAVYKDLTINQPKLGIAQMAYIETRDVLKVWPQLRYRG